MSVRKRFDCPYLHFSNADVSLLNLIPYRIEPSKFSVGNNYDTCENFIRAVIKVQQGKEDMLTSEEAKTIEPWKISTDEPVALDVEPQASGLSEYDRMNLERLQNKKARAQSNIVDSKYDPALKYCVLGSSAEVERVWSMAGHVLVDARSSMSPLIFELIMYLKYNKRLWGIHDVVTANRKRLSETPAAKRRSDREMERLKQMQDAVDDWEAANNIIG